MTYADPALLTARSYLITKGWPGNSVGIVGDPAHAATGGYHCGNDMLARVGRLDSDYSKRQSPRDRPGSNAAMALDIGGRSRAELADLTSFLIAEAKAGRDPDLREIMGPKPGGGIQWWDALGVRTGASGDHDWHAHRSYFRDSEGRDKTSIFKRYYGDLPRIQPAPSTPAPTPNQLFKRVDMTWFYFFTPASGSLAPLWGFGYVTPDGSRGWLEATSEGEANGYTRGTGQLNAAQLDRATYVAVKAKFTA